MNREKFRFLCLYCVETVSAACGRTYAADYIQRELQCIIRCHRGCNFESKIAAQWKEQLNRPHPTVATLRKDFDDAANEFGVPSELLQAIAQVESNWTQRRTKHRPRVGDVHLVRNSDCDTLGQAGAS